jgi:putative spermidine/putrescine transport system ATP-binding protein
MTVGENVGYPLKVRKMNKADIEAQVRKALEMVQMGEFADRMPAQLSGGQQQRIALARALVFEPQLVLMDEPLGALDKQLREHMQYEIKHIHETLGITVVYVTHDQSEALTMSDRIAVFDDGIIQQLASPSDLYERPENSFVAQFIGENNELRGMVSSVDGDTAEVTLENGAKVRALPVNIAGVGKPTLLSIRPERVILDPPQADDIPTLEGKVEQLIYLGDHIRCRISVAGNDEFIVKIPNDAEDKRLNAGETVMMGWHTADCRALDA